MNDRAAQGIYKLKGSPALLGVSVAMVRAFLFLDRRDVGDAGCGAALPRRRLPDFGVR
jgi:hypothetical protein